MKKINVFSIILLQLAIFINITHNFETKSEKCLLADSMCLTTRAQNTLLAFIEGNTTLGMKKMDKLLLDPVNTHVRNFSFEWTNVTVEGLQNAIIDNVSINLDFNIMRLAFHTTFLMKFDYNASGMLFSFVPILGAASGEITMENMNVEILFLFDIVKDDKGKDVMDIKTHYYGFHPAGGIHYFFRMGSAEDEKKGEVINKFNNENWKTVATTYGGFSIKNIADKILEAVKTYMRSRPLEDLALYP